MHKEVLGGVNDFGKNMEIKEMRKIESVMFYQEI